MIRIRDAMLCSGWLGVIAIGGAFLIAPVYRERSSVRDEIATLRAELAKPTDGPEVIERLTNDLHKLREFGRGRMTPIPDDSDVAGLMKMFSNTLGDLGLEKRDITTRPVRHMGDAASLPVTVTLSGPFPDIFAAVSSIESMPRLVRVERLRINVEESKSQPAHTSDPIVRAELSIDAFFNTPNSGAGGQP